MANSLFPTTQVFAPNGTSRAFTLNSIPAANSLIIALNGVILHPTFDYTLSGNVFTLVLVPSVGDRLLAFYTSAADFPAPPVRTPFAGSDWHSQGQKIHGTSPSRGWIQWMQQITKTLSAKQ
jgi:hypothetical protein